VAETLKITAYVTEAEQNLISAKIKDIEFLDYPEFEKRFLETDNIFLISAELLCDEAEAQRFEKLIKNNKDKLYILYAEQDDDLFGFLINNEAGKQMYRNRSTEDDFLDLNELVEWIEGRKEIWKIKAVKQDEKTVSVPVHILRQIGKLKKETLKLTEATGRTPSDEETAKALNWTVERIKSVTAILQELEQTLDAQNLEQAINEIQTRTYRLSKSRYVTGLRCPKILWLDKNKPELKAEETNTAAFEIGNKVGELARSYFGEHSLVPYSEDKSLMIAETERLLKTAKTICGAYAICEASFSHNGHFCSVDILTVDNNGLHIIEVKSATSVKDHYIDDMAFQYYVLTSCGLTVSKVSLMHINGHYERSGSLEINKLFTLADCTKEVIEKQKELEANIQLIGDTALMDEEPKTIMDNGCFEYNGCPYYSYCFKDLPEENIFTISDRALSFANKIRLYEKGIISHQDLLASNEEISADARLQMESRQNPPRPDWKSIKTFFEENMLWALPMYYLDFETYQEAIPSLDRQRPYQQIPFQYSLHIIRNVVNPLDDPASYLEHREFLAQTGTDPRRDFAKQLCADIELDFEHGAYIFVYNQAFEKTIIKELAALFPKYEDKLMEIHDHIIDLITPFKNRHWYDYNQHGSNSLKAVLPAMFPNDPELDYNALDLIHNGGEAMTAFPSLASKPPEEQQRIRTALLAYCRLDTLAMVKIHQRLEWLAAIEDADEAEQKTILADIEKVKAMSKEEFNAINNGLTEILDALYKEGEDAFEKGAPPIDTDGEYAKRSFARFGLHKVVISYLGAVGDRLEKKQN
jgi:hypothetical protein